MLFIEDLLQKQNGNKNIKEKTRWKFGYTKFSSQTLLANQKKPSLHLQMLTSRQSYHVNLVKCRAKVCLVWGSALIVLQMMKSYHLMCFHVKHLTQPMSEIKRGYYGTQISANLMMYAFSILFVAYGVIGLASEWWTLRLFYGWLV